MARRSKVIIALGFVLVALILLVLILRNSSLNYYITPEELKAKSSSSSGERLRVAGEIVDNSVNWDQGSQQLQFKITYPGEKEILPVVFKGYVPENFRNEGKVVVEGLLDFNGSFVADQILMRCPEKYLPERAVNGLSEALGIEGILYR